MKEHLQFICYMAAIVGAAATGLAQTPGTQKWAYNTLDKNHALLRDNPDPYVGWENYYGDMVKGIFSPDSKHLATIGYDGTVRIWNFDNGVQENILLDHTASIYDIAFSHDGAYLASKSWDFTVKIWRTRDWTLIRTIVNDDYDRAGGVYSNDYLSFSPQGTYLLSDGHWGEYHDHRIALRRVSDWDTVKTLQIRGNNFNPSITWSPDEKYVATGDRYYFGNYPVYIWDINDNRLFKQLNNHNNDVLSVSWSKDGKHLASGSVRSIISGGGRILIHNTENWQVEKEILMSNDIPHFMRWNFDNTLLASLYYSGHYDLYSISIWNTGNWNLNTTLSNNTIAADFFDWSSHGKYIAATGAKQTEVWDLATNKVIKTINGHNNSVGSVCYSPKGQYLASLGENSVKIWQTSDNTLVTSLDIDRPSSLAWSQDGNYLAAGGWNNIHIWRVNGFVEKMILQPQEKDYLYALVFSPNGNVLASGSDNWSGKVFLRMYDLNDGTLKFSSKLHTKAISSLTYSKNGNLLATGSSDNTIQIWNAKKSSLEYTLVAHSGGVYSVCFLDSTYLVSSGKDNTAKIWNVEEAKLVKTIAGSYAEIKINQTGNYCASANNNGLIDIFYTNSWELVHSIVFDHGKPFSIDWSPDGKKIFSGGWGYNNLRIYDVSPFTTGIKEPSPTAVPAAFALKQNYPNPFNPTTTIEYSVPKLLDIELKVYNIFGHEIQTLVNGRQEAGVHRVQFDSSGLPSGLYFYRLRTGEFVETKKMVVVR